MYTPLDIANWFIANIIGAGDAVTHLKLQKLVYYAQAWSLANLNKPLFEEDYQAWAHGPVVPSLYDQFRHYHWEALPHPESVPEFDEETESLLKDILEAYGEHSAKTLETLTHKEAPWKDARGNLPDEAKSNVVISKESMRKFYSELYKQIDGHN